MDKKYDAIVVGGGIAGLTCASYLCRSGVKTLLIEKNEATGGLMKSFSHRGFTFDAGIRALENSGALFPMLRELGIDMPTVKDAVSIRVGGNSVRIDGGDSLSRYAAMLTDIFPEDSADIKRISGEIAKVTSYMDVLYGVDNPLFRGTMSKSELLSLIPWLFNYKVKMLKIKRMMEPVYPYLRRFTDDPILSDMIAQHFFSGTPAFFALSYFGVYADYSYPIGGTSALPSRLTEYITSKGGEIATDSPVEATDPVRHTVSLSDGTVLCCDSLVWACDQKKLYAASCCGAEHRTIIEGSRGGDSVLSVYIGVSVESRCFHGHEFFTPFIRGLSSLSSFDAADAGGLNDMADWVREYLCRTTFEISCPCVRDSSLAPGGCTGIIASTLMDITVARSFAAMGAYDRFKKICTDTVVSILNATYCHDLSRNVLFALCSTPLTIERESGNSDGAITGWSFTNREMPAVTGFGKIASAVKTPFCDTYQCGQWSFSPSGLPVSIMTGRLAADAVIKGSGK